MKLPRRTMFGDPPASWSAAKYRAAEARWVFAASTLIIEGCSDAAFVTRAEQGVVGWLAAGVSLVALVSLVYFALRRALPAVAAQGEALTTLEVKRRALLEHALANSLVEASPKGIVALDREHRVIEWNPAMAHFTGIPRDEALGQSLDDVLPVTSSAGRAARLQQLFVYGTPFATEREFHFPRAGHTLILEVVASAVRDPASGLVTTALCTIRDITARRNAEQALRTSEARVQALVPSASSVILGLAPDHRIFEWNAAAEETYGVSREEALGLDFVQRFVPPEVRSQLTANIRIVLAGQPMRGFDSEIVLPNGRRALYRWNVSRIADATGSVAGLIAIGDDVTERQAAEERFRVLFESSSDAHLLFDETGIIDCNAAAVRLLRATSKSPILSLHPAVLSPDVQPDGRRSLEKSVEMDAIARRNGHHRFDWIHRRLDGTDIPVEVSLTPVKLRGRAAVLMVWHDLTERIAAEQALRRERSRLVDAIDALDSGFAMFDSNERLLAFNRRFQAAAPPGLVMRSADTTVTDILRARLVEGRHPVTGEPGDRWVAHTRARHHGPGETFEEQIGQRAMRIGVSRTTDGGSVVLLTDISALKEIQASLEQARDAANEASRAKSDFLARMSHELRTPLNSIIGFTRQVRKNRSGGLSATELTFLERVETNGINLLALINHILDISKIEAGKVEVELAPVDLGDLVRNTMAQLEGQPRRPGVALAAEIPHGLSSLVTDSAKLQQVIVNLVGNALKFTHEGFVTVRVEGDSDGQPTALEVRDTGIGIATDRLEAIFHAFEQAERTTARDYGGTGLGLSISRSLCCLLDASLEVTSLVGQGTTFRVTFGRSAAASPPAAMPATV